MTAALGCAAGAGVWTVVFTGMAISFALLAVGPDVERLFGGNDPELQEEERLRNRDPEDKDVTRGPPPTA